MKKIFIVFSICTVLIAGLFFALPKLGLSNNKPAPVKILSASGNLITFKVDKYKENCGVYPTSNEDFNNLSNEKCGNIKELKKELIILNITEKNNLFIYL